MKVLMVVAKSGFRDEEFKEPHNILTKNKVEVDIASTERGKCVGKFGTEIEANKSFDDITHIEDYSAIALIGGPGSEKLVGNKKLETILHSFADKGLIISAICLAPLILANAGLLKGKKATVWDSNSVQSSKLKKAGAEYVPKSVVKDGSIITANGADAAKSFGEELLKAIKK